MLCSYPLNSIGQEKKVNLFQCFGKMTYFCQIFNHHILDNTLENNIKELFSKKPLLKTSELLEFLQKVYPNVGDTTLYWRLHELRDKGIINRLGRGVYALTQKPGYLPELPLSLKRLYGLIRSNFPLITFCVWDSHWFNEFMVHQAFRHYYVIEVEKDAAESVFYRLSEKSKNIFLNPKKEIFDKYIVNLDEAIIINSLLSEAPLQKTKNFNIPTLEKLLVDCLVGDELFAAQQNDIEYIIQTAFERYNINPNKIKRYANRRNIKDKVETILSKYSANIV